MFLRSTACKINDKQDSGDVFKPSFAVRHFFCVRFNFHKLLENAPSKELLLPTVIIGVYRAQKNLINGFHYFPKNLKGLWHRLVQARPLDVLSSCCQQSCPQPVREESSQDAELTHKTKPLFFTVMTSSDIILGTTKCKKVGKKVWKEVGTPVVYLFIDSLPAICQLCDFFTELAQVQVVHWILLWSLAVDLLGFLQFCLHGGQQGLLQVQVVFNFLSQEEKKVQINRIPAWCYTTRKIYLLIASPIFVPVT